MPGFDTLVLQDTITAKVQTLLPNHEIIEDGIVDDVNLLRDVNGLLIPYVILRYGPLRRKPLGFAIAGARHDDYYSTCDALVVAPTGRMARAGLAIVTDGLIGYKPDGASEMVIEGGTSQFVVMSNEARPSAYVASVRFRYGVNQSNVSAHLTPPTP